MPSRLSPALSEPARSRVEGPPAALGAEASAEAARPLPLCVAQDFGPATLAAGPATARPRSRRPANRIFGVPVGGSMGPHFVARQCRLLLRGKRHTVAFPCALSRRDCRLSAKRSPPCGLRPLRRVLQTDADRPGSRGRAAACPPAPLGAEASAEAARPCLCAWRRTLVLRLSRQGTPPWAPRPRRRRRGGMPIIWCLRPVRIPRKSNVSKAVVCHE